VWHRGFTPALLHSRRQGCEKFFINVLLVTVGVATMALPEKALGDDCHAQESTQLWARDKQLYKQLDALHIKCSVEGIALQKKIIANDDQFISLNRSESSQCQQLNASVTAGWERARSREKDVLNNCLAQGVPLTDEVAYEKALKEAAARDEELAADEARRIRERDERAPPPVNQIPEQNPFAAAPPKPAPPTRGTAGGTECVQILAPGQFAYQTVCRPIASGSGVQMGPGGGSGTAPDYSAYVDAAGRMLANGGTSSPATEQPPSNGNAVASVEDESALDSLNKRADEIHVYLPPPAPDKPGDSVPVKQPLAESSVKKADVSDPNKDSLPGSSLPMLCGGGFDTFYEKGRDGNGPFDVTCIVAKNSCPYEVRFRYRLSKSTLCPNVTAAELRDPNNLKKCTVDVPVGPAKEGKATKSVPVCTTVAGEAIYNYGIYKPPQ
jgi:hypothetical protein